MNEFKKVARGVSEDKEKLKVLFPLPGGNFMKEVKFQEMPQAL